jgi:hypothetical protein
LPGPIHEESVRRLPVRFGSANPVFAHHWQGGALMPCSRVAASDATARAATFVLLGLL